MTVVDTPISQGGWNESVCIRTRNDPITGDREIEGRVLYLEGGEKPLATWRPDNGWVEGDFAQTPVARIKGWLEIAEYLIEGVQRTEACDRLLMLRSVVDVFAVVDVITSEHSVQWGPALYQLFNALRAFTLKLSDDLIVPADGGHVDPVNPELSTTPGAMAARLDQAPHRQQVANLKSSVGLMSRSINQNKATIEDVGTVTQVVGSIIAAVEEGLEFIADVAAENWFRAVKDAVEVVVAVVAVIQGIAKIIRRWFRW